jgi:hypothetical protein
MYPVIAVIVVAAVPSVAMSKVVDPSCPMLNVVMSISFAPVWSVKSA